MGLFKKVNHNNLNNRATQAATAKLKATQPSTQSVPRGQGTVQQPSNGQRRRARWS